MRDDENDDDNNKNDTNSNKKIQTTTAFQHPRCPVKASEQMSRLQVSSIMSLLFQLLLLSSIATTTITFAQECAPNGICDTHPRCPVWRDEGECKLSIGYMKKYCPVSCGYAKTSAESAQDLVAKSALFGVKQEAVGESQEQTLEIIRKSIEYMKEPRDVNFCKNKHEYCSFWATVGE